MLSAARFYAALAATIISAPIQGQQLSAAPVQYIDHIMIRSDDPDELFALFSKTFQLPIAWPLAERGGVVSGGIGFGNVNIEAIMFPGRSTILRRHTWSDSRLSLYRLAKACANLNAADYLRRPAPVRFRRAERRESNFLYQRHAQAVFRR